MTYLGHRFVIPASWPVIDLAARPTACVRSDRHALYLGKPGTRQSCPAGAAAVRGRLVQPWTTAAAETGTGDQRLDHEYLAMDTNIRVTATYSTDKSLVRGILRGAGLPTRAPSRGKQPPATEPPALPLSATSYTGKGFDTCTAPSSGAMSDWRAGSPYRAVGIYIRGAQRACSQPNLTASWVKTQATAGWHFIPLYVGLQADQITSAADDGRRSADDAIEHAQSLGFGAGTPLYYDMEAYHFVTAPPLFPSFPPGPRNCTPGDTRRLSTVRRPRPSPIWSLPAGAAQSSRMSSSTGCGTASLTPLTPQCPALPGPTISGCTSTRGTSRRRTAAPPSASTATTWTYA